MGLEKSGVWCHTLLMNIAPLLLPWLFGFAAVITGVTHEANELWPESERDHAVQERREADWKNNPNIPEWSSIDAKHNPNCRKNTGKEKPFSFNHFLVVKQNGNRVQMSFDETIRRTQDKPDFPNLKNGQTMTSANDVWVIGVCNK